MELSAYHAAHRMIGDADHRDALPLASFYLLDRGFTVLSQHGTSKEAHIGAQFFDVLPAAREEREEIRSLLHAYGNENVLGCCCGVPVLFLGALLRKTGLLLAVIPEGKAYEVLSYPCVLSGMLNGLVLTHGALGRYKKWEGEELEVGCQFYLSHARVLSHKGVAGVGNVDVAALGHRAEQLARLTGTRLQFDLTGLGIRYAEALDAEWFTGVVLAALMAAARLGESKTICLSTERAFPHYAVLRLCFRRSDEMAPVTEFAPLFAVSRMRHHLFEAESYPEDLNELQIYTFLTPVELSAQEIKEMHLALQGVRRALSLCLETELPYSTMQELELTFDEKVT